MGFHITLNKLQRLSRLDGSRKGKSGNKSGFKSRLLKIDTTGNSNTEVHLVFSIKRRREGCTSPAALSLFFFPLNKHFWQKSLLQNRTDCLFNRKHCLIMKNYKGTPGNKAQEQIHYTTSPSTSHWYQAGSCYNMRFIILITTEARSQSFRWVRLHENNALTKYIVQFVLIFSLCSQKADLNCQTGKCVPADTLAIYANVFMKQTHSIYLFSCFWCACQNPHQARVQ